MNIPELSSRSLALFEMSSYLPTPPVDILDAALLQKARDLIASNISEPDVCGTSTVGVNDLLCSTVKGAALIDDVEATTFPTFSCHSPNDEIITFYGNVPNISVNPLLLSNFTVLGEKASADHIATLLFCQFGYILRCSSLGDNPPLVTGIDPLPNPLTCPSNTAAPVTATPVTPAPVTTAPVIPVTPAPVTPVSHTSTHTLVPTMPPTLTPTVPPTPQPTAFVLAPPNMPMPTGREGGSGGMSKGMGGSMKGMTGMKTNRRLGGSGR